MKLWITKRMGLSLILYLLQESPLTVILELGHPALYSWPQIERIDMFDVGDLDAKAVFVLVTPLQTEEYVVYVWVGRECNQQTENDEMYWQSIAQEFLLDLKRGARNVCVCVYKL